MPGAGWLALNAMKGLNGGDLNLGAGQSDKVDEELFEHAEEDEDVIVYSGEEYDAVVNDNGLVKTEEEEYRLSHDINSELVGEIYDLDALDNSIGFDLEEDGDTDIHVYLGEPQNYEGEVEDVVQDDSVLRSIQEKLSYEKDEDSSEELYEAAKAL